MIALVFVVGMALPVLLVVPVWEVLALYLSGRQVLIPAAVVFALLVWVLLTVVEFDRLNVVMAALIVPWAVGFGLRMMTETLEWGALEYLFSATSTSNVLTYIIACTVAAGVGSALALGSERLSQQTDGRLQPRYLPVGVLVVVCLGLVAGAGYATVATNAGSITDVETTTVDDTGGYRPVGMTVGVRSDAPELRLRVTAPDGTTTLARLTDDDPLGSTCRYQESVDSPSWGPNSGPYVACGPAFREEGTVAFALHQLHSGSFQTGTYEIQLVGVTGLTVDRETYTIESGLTPVLRGTDVVEPGTEPEFDVPADTPVREWDAERNLGIATLVENEGDVAGTVHTRVRTANGEFSRTHEIVLSPGESGVTIIGIPEEQRALIQQESEGTVEVDILVDKAVVVTKLVDEEVVATRSVALPENDGE